MLEQVVINVQRIRQVAPHCRRIQWQQIVHRGRLNIWTVGSARVGSGRSALSNFGLERVISTQNLNQSLSEDFYLDYTNVLIIIIIIIILKNNLF